MAEKLGVYICGGCDISKAINVEEMAEFVSKKFKNVAVVKTHPILCSKDGADTIRADIKEQGLDGVSICACSPRVKWDVFNFEDVQLDRANIREQAVWSFKDWQPEGATAPAGVTPELLKMLVQDYIKMSIVKVQNSAAPEVDLPETSKTIMVLGGGNTGLTAALGAASAGYDVVVVEKESALGGFAAKMYKKIPSVYPYGEAQDTGIDAKIAAVKSNPRIKVLTGATLAKLTGAPGIYDATLTVNGSDETLKIGAVIVATGFKPYDAAGKLEPMGYGKFKNVVTNVEFEAMVKNGGIKRPSDGQPAKSVAFIQCAGQRSSEEGMLPYCSAVCCLASLKQANYVREFNPDATAYIFYKDMIVPGIHERYYKAAQDDPGVMLTKGDIADVREDSDGGIILEAHNTLFNENIEVKADLLVLAAGMVPTTLEDPIVNFDYRQGPAFPDLPVFDGFADSNYICFPYETRRTGVYAAGCVRQPMLMGAAEDDASGAVLKAIQCISSINRGVAVHPRSGDTTFPVFNFVRCTQCKRCTEECPFGALDDDEKGTPKPNPTRCRRCGTCMGACPERVISFSNYSVGQIGSMIKEVEVPNDMKKGGPRVIVLVCENDAYPALDMAAFRGEKINPFVRFISVRCLGSVNTIWIADSLSKGIDGVLLLGCTYGDDYPCHFVEGSELCNRRMDNIGETMDRLGVEKQRVRQLQVAIDEYDKIPEMIQSFMDEIFKMGPNPYK